MLHKHPSAEKAQNYFGISEKVKHDSANFFIYIQPKLGNIYDNSIARALDEHFASQFIRDRHLSHLSTLLAGGIDHGFIEESHAIWLKYSTHGVTTGEYIKLYQLIISYLSGEAHKKHWWRYKKYRDLNRAIRNLLLFDLAIGTSSNDRNIELNNLKLSSHSAIESTALLDPTNDLQRSIDDLTELAQKSYEALHQGYNTIQEILELTADPSKTSKNTDNISTSKESVDHSKFEQACLFAYEDNNEELSKSASNENKPAFLELASQVHKKIQKISTLLMNSSLSSHKSKVGNLETMIQEVELDIENVIKNLTQENKSKNPKDLLSGSTSHSELYHLLHKSSEAIEEHLNKMAYFKEKKLYLK